MSEHPARACKVTLATATFLLNDHDSTHMAPDAESGFRNTPTISRAEACEIVLSCRFERGLRCRKLV
jgi:hypothetical protein